MNHIGIQSFSEQIRIKGAEQFWNIPGIEFANAKLLILPEGYYLAVTTYENNVSETRKSLAEHCITFYFSNGFDFFKIEINVT